MDLILRIGYLKIKMFCNMALLNIIHEGGCSAIYKQLNTQIVFIINLNVFEHYLHSMAVSSQEFLKTK